jgi:4-hydroxy-tetrahydrodipicolinate reductase
VELTGEPPLKLTVPGGIHGDYATAAVAVNCVPAMRDVKPGLRTSLDMPMGYFAGVDVEELRSHPVGARAGG